MKTTITKILGWLGRELPSLLAPICVALAVYAIPNRVFAYVGQGMPFLLAGMLVALCLALIHLIAKTTGYAAAFRSAAESMEREKRAYRRSQEVQLQHAREMLGWMEKNGAGAEELRSFRTLVGELAELQERAISNDNV